METIKVILNNTPNYLREICLEVTGEFYPSNTNVSKVENNIIVTVENDDYIDRIYGREIQGKLYFARHEFISKNLPDIDYYEEFFCNGVVMDFN